MRQPLQAALRSLGRTLLDRGDVQLPAEAAAAERRAALASLPSSSEPSSPSPSGRQLRNAASVGAANSVLREAAEASAREGDFTLVVGGDHSVAIGSIAGALAARPGLRVLWVDAHADINTPSSSPSGNLHGMPLALLLRLFEPPAPAFSWLAGTPALQASALAYVALRDLDAGEVQLIGQLGIRAFTMADIDRKGIGAVMKEALKWLAAGSGSAAAPLHLSLDIDACDPSVAPATGTAVQGGLSYREAHFICEACAESGRLVSMDIVEVNPLLGGESRGASTVANATAFVASALGKVTLPPPQQLRRK